jgi:hypothetical protein
VANQIAFPAFSGSFTVNSDEMRQFIQALELRLQGLEAQVEDQQIEIQRLRNISQVEGS